MLGILHPVHYRKAGENKGCANSAKYSISGLNCSDHLLVWVCNIKRSDLSGLISKMGVSDVGLDTFVYAPKEALLTPTTIHMPI
jgi:hypothetical protein